MLRSLQAREFAEGLLYCFDIERGAKREMIQPVSHLQALQLENGADRHEDMVLLGAEGPGRRLGSGGIGLERFVLVLDPPPFLMEVGDTVAIARQITANQTQPACAAVLVRKDPANQKDFVIKSLQPTAHSLRVR